MEIFIKPEHLLVKTSVQLQDFKCTHYLIITTIREVEAWPPLPKVNQLLLPGVTWEVSPRWNHLWPGLCSSQRLELAWASLAHSHLYPSAVSLWDCSSGEVVQPPASKGVKMRLQASQQTTGNSVSYTCRVVFGPDIPLLIKKKKDHLLTALIASINYLPDDSPKYLFFKAVFW